MATTTAVREITLADYLRMPETLQPTEIVNGRLTVMPAPVPEHQLVVRAISLLLEEPVERAGVGKVFQSPLDVLIRERPLTVRQPDLFVVAAGEMARHPGYRKAVPMRARPLLCIQVLSPGNTPRNLDDLMDDYAAIAEAEVRLVSGADKSIEVRQLQGGGYLTSGTYHGGDAVVSPALPHLSLRAAQLFE